MGLRSEDARQYLDCLERRRPHLVALLHGIGFSWDDAEDAAQQAIIEALALIKAEVVESIQNRWAWLIAVAHNKACVIGRRQKRWLPLDDDAIETRPIEAWEEKEDRQACIAAVRSAIERLPLKFRETVTYCYLEGHTYAEAAVRFQIGHGAVRRRLQTARAMLYSRLINGENRAPMDARRAPEI
jgi:RNA polymerase sigma factor (sigma-70 family)